MLVPRYRERTTGGVVSVATSYQRQASNGTIANPFPEPWNLLLQVNGDYCSQEKWEGMSDVIEPGFFKLRDEGRVVNHPYAKTTIETLESPLNLDYAVSVIRTVYDYNLGQNVQLLTNDSMSWQGAVSPREFLTIENCPETPTLDTVAVNELAVTNAHAKIDASSIASLPALAESGKTIRDMASIAKRAIKIIRHLRKAELYPVLRELSPRKLSERWMEGRYAIRPLIYDMKGAVEAYCRSKQLPPRHTYRASARDYAQETEVDYTTAFYAKLRVHRSYTTTHVYSARSGVLTAIGKISDASIWGLDQPVQALWELFPFSYVCDWFFNVGKVIASHSPHYGIDVLASWLVTEEVISRVAAVSDIEDVYVAPDSFGRSAGPKHLNYSGGWILHQTTNKSRAINPQLPIMPHFQLRLDAAKLLDLAIIGKQLMKA